MDQPDFVIISGDVYVDIPTNGTAIIKRLLESKGYSVSVYEVDDKGRFDDLPKPGLAFLLTSGIMDSTLYARPGERAGRKVVEWCKKLRKRFPGSKIVVGGLESSIRRLAHYDMFVKKVVPSIMMDMEADILVYGMGERQMLEIAEHLSKGEDLKGIRGTVWKTSDASETADSKRLPTYEEVRKDKDRFIDSFNEQAKNTDPFDAERLVEEYTGKTYIVQEPPALPLTPAELDYINELPYTRTATPGRFPIGMMRQAIFSVVTHRGCFAGCNFCTIMFHQGKTIISRSEKSILAEVRRLVKRKEFKGTIYLVSPSANMYGMSCRMKQHGSDKMTERSVIDGKIEFSYDKRFHCHRSCLPGPCVNLQTDFAAFRRLLREVKKVPGVKDVELVGGFVYDLLMRDPKMMEYLLKEKIEIIVAREHDDDKVLALMNRPKSGEYKRFRDILARITEKTGCKPDIKDHVITGYPGATADAKLKKQKGQEVSELKPLPMTASGVMKHTQKDLKKKKIG